MIHSSCNDNTKALAFGSILRMQCAMLGGIVLAISLPAPSAIAERYQDNDARNLVKSTPGQANLPDLVVTARKRAESQQSVPGSMTVRTTEQLADMGTMDLRDAASGIPNLTVGTFATRRLTFPYMRGIGSGQNAPGGTHIH